ncbi:hypothetical protein C8R43DRAFT_1181112 [Mycena crocata]|nr:hypothetical protein C8R43DRAFT_1181112 [Mycena crocata]
MSRDVSEILGQFMLKGWVLTDRTCPTAGCSVPLMRSPTGKTPVAHFCASCDGSPDDIRVRPPATQLPDSSLSASSSSQFSRSSTPPTEVSSTLSSPVYAPPAETEESRRRREQSDAASAAIGQRLLKGWAMLADECPNVHCFGVPLVRPPKAGGEKDPRKECVICGMVYLTEIDWAGRERLVSQESLSMTTPVADKGKARETEIDDHKPSEAITDTQAPPPVSRVVAPSLVMSNSTSSALDESAQRLEATLRALSGRMASLTAGKLDPSAIGSVADTISKVVVALGQVKQLQWAEQHAGESL